MSSQPIPLSGQHHEQGLADTMRSLFHAALHYADVRLRLFWLESRDMLHRGLLLVALAIMAAISVIITYFGLMIALVLWIARTWWGGDALPAVMIVALGHLLVAVTCGAIIAYATRHTHLFHATLREFKEDKQWLHENQTSRN